MTTDSNKGTNKVVARAVEPGWSRHTVDQIDGANREYHDPNRATRHGGNWQGPPFHFNVDGGVYVLRCEDNRYYVGMTTDFERRIWTHFQGDGAIWTQMYQPLEVKTILTTDDCNVRYENTRTAEDAVTTEYMKKHGVKRVRGGSWAHPDLDQCPQLPAELLDCDTESQLDDIAETLCSTNA